MTRCGRTTLFLLLSAVSAATWSQVPTNGSFETGDLTGWTTGGYNRAGAIRSSNITPNTSLTIPDGTWAAAISTGPGEQATGTTGATNFDNLGGNNDYDLSWLQSTFTLPAWPRHGLRRIWISWSNSSGSTVALSKTACAQPQTEHNMVDFTKNPWTPGAEWEGHDMPYPPVTKQLERRAAATARVAADNPDATRSASPASLTDSLSDGAQNKNEDPDAEVEKRVCQP